MYFRCNPIQRIITITLWVVLRKFLFPYHLCFQMLLRQWLKIYQACIDWQVSRFFSKELNVFVDINQQTLEDNSLIKLSLLFLLSKLISGLNSLSNGKLEKIPVMIITCCYKIRRKSSNHSYIVEKIPKYCRYQ